VKPGLVSEARIEEHLIAVRAKDGLSLSGFEVKPAGGRATACVVWAHGFGVTYDLPQCIRFGRELARRNIAFVAGNLRGHAGAVTGWRNGGGHVDYVRIGSWWEVFEESALDIAAWVDHGLLVGAPTLILGGHSFGALRAVFYLSESGDRRVDGLVLASLSFGLRKLDESTAGVAVRMVGEGRGEELLPEGSWPTGFGTRTVSAQTYASWWRVAPGFFGQAAHRFADITCPILMWYGSQRDVGGNRELDYVSKLARGGARVDRRILNGVTHAYDGGEATMAEALAGWSATLRPTVVSTNQVTEAKE
jgi:serine aminopeptidase S33 family